MRLAIETKNLSKRYGDVRAVEGLSMRVTEGELYAFLGLNGAGKTTTIRLLLGMIRPSAGSASVLGTPVRLGAVRPWAGVGYLVETPQAYPELTVRDNLEAARRLHPGTEKAAVSRAIEELGLVPYADRRAGTLSLGNKQRLGLAKALIHRPRLLMLDEPANGLDPVGIVEIRELLRRLTREEGVTVFMSSHILGEVSRLADRIGIIHAGRLIQEMDADQLERERRRRLLVKARSMEAAQATLRGAGRVATLNGAGCLALSDADSVARPDEIARMLAETGTPPTYLAVDEEDLEAYFLRLVGMEGLGNHDHAA